MNRWTAVVLMAAMIFLLALGCSGKGEPVSPGDDDTHPGSTEFKTTSSNTGLWGYYDVSIDPDTWEATVTPNRAAMFTANVVEFLNSNPASIGVEVKSEEVTEPEILIVVKISITHPLPLDYYNGYDVRGVFIGSGDSFAHQTEEVSFNYRKLGSSYMPVSDGHTRWYNPKEFALPGLFGYTQGVLAPTELPNAANVNPYKYFAHGLGEEQDVWEYLQESHPENEHGAFLAGETLSRDYEINFPIDGGLEFNYAVVANWQGEDPSDHPSHTLEAIGVSVVDNSDIFYVNETDKGGDMILDISLFSWDENFRDSLTSFGIDSNAFANKIEILPQQPIGGGSNYSTWHVEIPILGPDSTEELQTIIYTSCGLLNYSADPEKQAPNEEVKSYFIRDIQVEDVHLNLKPECVLQVVTVPPYVNWADDCEDVEFDASGSTDPDGDSGNMTFDWDFDGDGAYGEPGDDDYTGPENQPVHKYCVEGTYTASVKVTDEDGKSSECSLDIEITLYDSKHIDVDKGAGSSVVDLAGDPFTGDYLILYTDGIVRRYFRDEFFTDFTEYTVEPDYEYIDMCAAGNFHITRTTLTSDGYSFYMYDNSGNFVYAQPFQGVFTPSVVVDAYAFGLTPPYSTRHGILVSSELIPDIFYAVTMANWMHAVPTSNTAQNFFFDPFVGPGSLKGSDLVAAEVDGGQYVWILQKNNAYVSRFNAQTMAFDTLTAYWADGAPTDSDLGFNDPRDLAGDNMGNFFILDQLSTGDYKIKSFNWDGATTSDNNGFGLSVFSTGAIPIRIEGNFFDDGIAVLHRGGGEELSFFTESEIAGLL